MLEYYIKKMFGSFASAHVQSPATGKCGKIHGHNWIVEIDFGCQKLDENGFVINFNNLKEIEQFLNKMLDHTLMVSEEDPRLPIFKKMHECDLADVIYLKNGASAENLSLIIFNEASKILHEKTSGRVWVEKVIVHEDEKDSAFIKSC